VWGKQKMVVKLGKENVKFRNSFTIQKKNHRGGKKGCGGREVGKKEKSLKGMLNIITEKKENIVNDGCPRGRRNGHQTKKGKTL